MRFRAPGADDEMRVELTSMTDIIFLLLILVMQAKAGKSKAVLSRRRILLLMKTSGKELNRSA